MIRRIKHRSVLIFPYFNSEYYLFQALKIHGADVCLATFKNSYLVGKDANSVRMLEPRVTEILSIEDIDSTKFDTIIIPDLSLSTVKLSKSLLTSLGFQDQKIFCLSDFNPAEGLYSLIEKRAQLLKSFGFSYSDFNIPVVFIGQIAENPFPEYMGMAISKALQSQEIRVARISTIDKYCFLENSININRMIDKIKINDIIPYLNTLIHAYIMISKADILLVNIPGTWNREDHSDTKDFGFYYYLLTQIVKPDYSIINVPLQTHYIQNLDIVSSQVKSMIGIDPDVFVLSNIISNKNMSIDQQSSHYYTGSKYTKTVPLTTSISEHERFIIHADENSAIQKISEQLLLQMS